MDELKILLDQAIRYEDEFIETYLKLIRDEGFMLVFGDKQEQAKEKLNILIEESRGHKQALDIIINNLK